jgi:xylulose-5-phosphate/fructose-6-phosphate phosphoketolase
VDGHYLEGFWRAHQVPIADVATNPAHLKLLEQWMRSYKPQELFDEGGRIIPELKALAPKGHRRMSANPVANGGLLRKPLDLPDFRKSAVAMKKRGATLAGNVPILGNFLRDLMRKNMQSFRIFGPDETQSNQLQAIYEVGKKVWLGEYFEEDADGGELVQNGRVMEMLSEHTVEGWLEGYILTGRHGLINSYDHSFMSSTRCSTNTPSGWKSAASCRGAHQYRRSTFSSLPWYGDRTTTASRRIPGFWMSSRTEP